MKNVLVINCGSSSLKYQLLDMEDERLLARGLVERIGLDEVADNRMRTFSTGMRKRLALGQLLVRPIQVALLDEPYSGLDSQGMRLVDEVIGEFKAAGTTVLLASHQDGEAVRISDYRGRALALSRSLRAARERLESGERRTAGGRWWRSSAGPSPRMSRRPDRSAAAVDRALPTSPESSSAAIRR